MWWIKKVVEKWQLAATPPSRSNNLKSDIHEGRYYIECGCHDSDHLLVFWFDPLDKEEWMMVTVGFTSQYHATFWERVKTAWSYIFNRERHLRSWDEILINKNNIDALKQAVNEIEKLAKTKKLI